MGNAEDGHARAADQPHILVAAVNRCMITIELKGLSLLTAASPGAAAALGQDGTKPLKIDLIQIADHRHASRNNKRWSNHTVAPSLYNK